MRSRRVLVRVVPLVAIVMLVLGGLVSLASAGSPEATTSKTITDDSSKRADRTRVLYYFHGTRRCNTCRTIEAYAQEVVEDQFKDALQSGTLSWTVLNTDEPENAHFVKQFGLVSSSLVLVEVAGGEVVRHQVLQDAWTLVRDKPRFIEYVQGAVGEFLE